MLEIVGKKLINARVERNLKRWGSLYSAGFCYLTLHYKPYLYREIFTAQTMIGQICWKVSDASSSPYKSKYSSISVIPNNSLLNANEECLMPVGLTCVSLSALLEVTETIFNHVMETEFVGCRSPMEEIGSLNINSISDASK